MGASARVPLSSGIHTNNTNAIVVHPALCLHRCVVPLYVVVDTTVSNGMHAIQTAHRAHLWAWPWQTAAARCWRTDVSLARQP
jgi:hypothetical protein